MINPYKLHTELYRGLESLISISRIKRAQQEQQPAEKQSQQPAEQQGQQPAEQQVQQPAEQQSPPSPTENALRFWLGNQGTQRFSNIMTRKPRTHTIEAPGLARNRFRKTIWVSNPFGGGYHFYAPRQTAPYNPYPWMQGGGGGQQGGGGGMGDNNMMQFLLLKELMSKQDTQSQILGFIAQIIGAFQPQISEWLEQVKQQRQQKGQEQQQQKQQQQQSQQQQQPPQTKQSSWIPEAVRDVAKNPLWFVPGLTFGLAGAGLGAGGYLLAPYFYTDPIEVRPRQVMLGALLGALSGTALEIAYRSWARAMS